jgi:hypothetical protein
VIARVSADVPEQNDGPTFSFEEAERGLNYPPGTLRKAADEAGWTEMHTLNPERLCAVLCLIWPQMPEE